MADRQTTLLEDLPTRGQRRDGPHARMDCPRDHPVPRRPRRRVARAADRNSERFNSIQILPKDGRFHRRQDRPVCRNDSGARWENGDVDDEANAAANPAVPGAWPCRMRRRVCPGWTVPGGRGVGSEFRGDQAIDRCARAAIRVRHGPFPIPAGCHDRPFHDGRTLLARGVAMRGAVRGDRLPSGRTLVVSADKDRSDCDDRLRPRSNSSSTWKRQGRWGSACRPPCWLAPTR